MRRRESEPFMNIVFFGSSEFSIAALKACMETPNRVVQVITTPEKKRGRGQKVSATLVQNFAVQSGLPIAAPSTLKDEALLNTVRTLKPDLFVCSSYGKLIPSAWLQVPSRLCINVHPSLLPKYRGAAPLNWPILNGDRETGLSLAEITSKLDAGDIFFQERLEIPPEMDSGQLSGILADKSYGALIKLFERIAAGQIDRTPQDDAASSYARMIVKKDGLIQWQQSAAEISRKVRGLVPWPRAYTLFQGEPLQILRARACEGAFPDGAPGELVAVQKDGSGIIRTADGCLQVFEVKPAGKSQMNAADFVRGRRLAPGYRFQSIR